MNKSNKSVTKNTNKCFVCHTIFNQADLTLNHKVLLFVCTNCKGTENENKEIEVLLKSLADDFICGCI